MDGLKVEHLPFVGAGEFDTSYTPIDFYDGDGDRFHVRCVVNYGSFDIKEQYREGGILWIVEDKDSHNEIHLIGQEGDARLILFAENKERNERAETEYSLSETAYSHVAKGCLFKAIRQEIANRYDIAEWQDILQVAFADIDMDETLRGLGYSEE